jgi:hypothetical protein
MTLPSLRSTCLAIIALGFAGFAITPARAVGPDQAKADQTALITALKTSKITLEDGIKTSQQNGTPISAKFEMEDDHLQFSAYTMKGDEFNEVVVEPSSGAIKSAEKITNPEDLAAAKAQKSALARSTIPLSTAAQNAARENAEGRLISVVPEINNGKPVATISLLSANSITTILGKLD